MTGREKLRNALAHKKSRVPVDIGSTPVTGIHVAALAGLRKYYGLGDEPIKVFDPSQMLGLVENDLLDILGVDVVGIFNPKTKFGFENDGWKEWKTPWGQIVLVGNDFQVDEIQEGIFIYPQGDRSVPPSGKMPWDGWYFDAITRQEADQNRKPQVEDNLEEYGVISERTVLHLREQAERIEPTGRGVVAVIGGTGLGDVANIPGPSLKHPKGVRDIAQWYMTTATDPGFVRDLFERQIEIAMKNLEIVNASLGNRIDVIYLCGTDFGTQRSTIISEKTFRNLWLPYYRRMNDWIHRHTAWKTFKHSCGAVSNFLPLFIESGFDIINPVQCSAHGMDPETIKDRYGDDLVFWGGGVDTQHVLPFGSVEEVRRQVLKRCETFSKNGGFVFNTIHNLQAGIPIENIAAIFDALAEFNTQTDIQDF